MVDEALKNISFQQRTAHLVGSVECLDDNVCGDVNVVLRGLDPLEDEYHEMTKGSEKMNIDRNFARLYLLINIDFVFFSKRW